MYLPELPRELVRMLEDRRGDAERVAQLVLLEKAAADVDVPVHTVYTVCTTGVIVRSRHRGREVRKREGGKRKHECGKRECGKRSMGSGVWEAWAAVWEG